MKWMSEKLGKAPDKICKKDVLKYIKENKIQILNLSYIGSDSKLKHVSFPASDLEYMESVLSLGERTAGVFPGVAQESADLYAMPRYRDAFPNPFTEKPTLNMLCSFFDKDGNLLEFMPENILNKAHTRLTKETGFSLKAGGELEYYVIYPNTGDLWKTFRKNYHDSSPFNVWEDMRDEILVTLMNLKIPTKYAHSEVGKIHNYSEGFSAEQHEIEFPLTPIDEAAENTVIAKWVTCNVAKKYGVCATFAPVIKYGETGSGLHFHLELLKKDKSAILDKQGKLSIESKKMIGGMLKFSRSLAAFGNPTPISYLRFAAKKDAPSAICWGERNRKALVRIPLGWREGTDMLMAANPCEKGATPVARKVKQTIEFRAADGTAAIQLLLTGLILAVENGLKDDASLKVTEELYVAEKETLREGLQSLPLSCRESAEALDKDRKYYEGTLPSGLIDYIIKELKNCKEEDEIINKRDEKKEELKKLVEKYLHY